MPDTLATCTVMSSSQNLSIAAVLPSAPVYTDATSTIMQSSSMSGPATVSPPGTAGQWTYTFTSVTGTISIQPH